MEELKCDICGKGPFKSLAGLFGHKKITHGAEKRKSYPDEIGKRLEKIEQALGTLVRNQVAEDVGKIAIRKGLSADKATVLLRGDDYKIVRKCIEEFYSGSDYEKTLGEYFREVKK